MHRIVILGTSGSGKTTLARNISRIMKIPHIEMDAIHWKANWTPSSTEEMLPRVRNATAQAFWVLDGNYRTVRDVIWERADTIIWLDYEMRVVFLRVLRRTLRRWWTKEQLWSGNRERLMMQFFERDSILLWVINTWRIRRRKYPAELRAQMQRGKRVLRFRNPAQTESWLSGLSRSSSKSATG